MKIINKRLLTILNFIEEIEKLKHVYRINTLSDKSRQESDAEHSWHLAIMVLLLKDELGVKFNVAKAIRLALVHDLVEIYTGDCWPANEQERKEKKKREDESTKKLLAQITPDLKKEFKKYFAEYEQGKTKEAKVVKALDKIVYPMHYAMSGKIVYHLEQDSPEGRRAYGMPHVGHNKILTEIFLYYHNRLDKVQRQRELPLNKNI